MLQLSISFEVNCIGTYYCAKVGGANVVDFYWSVQMYSIDLVSSDAIQRSRVVCKQKHVLAVKNVNNDISLR